MQLVISDAHRGLRTGVDAVLLGAAWQRRWSILCATPPGAEGVGRDGARAAIRTIFAQPSAELVREQVDTVAAMLAPKFPAVADLLHQAKPT